MHILTHTQTRAPTHTQSLHLSLRHARKINLNFLRRHLETKFSIVTMVLAHNVEPDFIAGTLVIYSHLHVLE